MEKAGDLHQIAARFLISDADLGLTFIPIALSHPEGARRRLAMQDADATYQTICKLRGIVRMSEPDLVELRKRLDKLSRAKACPPDWSAARRTKLRF